MLDVEEREQGEDTGIPVWNLVSGVVGRCAPWDQLFQTVSAPRANGQWQSHSSGPPLQPRSAELPV